MGTPSSGVIALSDLKNEWSDTNPVSLSEFYAGGTYVGADAVGVPTSGTVSLSQYYNLYNVWASGIYTSSGSSSFYPIYGAGVDSSNNIYFATTTGLLSSTATVVKVNSSGTIQWQYNYSSVRDARKAKVDSSGNIYLIGNTDVNVSPRTDGQVIKIDSNGSVQWARSFYVNGFSSSSSRSTTVSDVAIDSSGNVYVSGTYQLILSLVSFRNQAFIVKLNSSGSILWYRYFVTYTPSNGYAPQVNTAIAVDASGNCYINGSATSPGSGATWAKFDTNGNYLTFANYDTTFTRDIVIDGNGYINFPDASTNVSQIDSSLNYRWNLTSALPYNSIFRDSSNNLYLNYNDFSGGQFSKLNNSGTLQWQRANKFNQGFADGGSRTCGAGIDSSGNLYNALTLGDGGFAYVKKYPNNVYLPVSTVNVFTTNSVTYKYQTLSSAFSSAGFPTNTTSGYTADAGTPGYFDQYTNSISVSSAGLSTAKFNSAY